MTRGKVGVAYHNTVPVSLACLFTSGGGRRRVWFGLLTVQILIAYGVTPDSPKGVWQARLHQQRSMCAHSLSTHISIVWYVDDY